MFTVYALHSPRYGKIYVGYTSNLEQRLLSHNKLGTKGWTIRYRPWKLIYTEAHESRSEAMKRERKRLSPLHINYPENPFTSGHGMAFSRDRDTLLVLCSIFISNQPSPFLN